MEHCVSCLLISALFGAAAPSGDWHLDYGDAIREVRNEDKPLFVVVSPRSSDFGREVTQPTFLNEDIEQELDEHYLRMYVDPRSSKGKKLAERFRATSYPHVVVIDRTGKWQVYRRGGPHRPADVARVLERHRRARRARPEPVFSQSSQSRFGLQWGSGLTTRNFSTCPT